MSAVDPDKKPERPASTIASDLTPATSMTARLFNASVRLSEPLLDVFNAVYLKGQSLEAAAQQLGIDDAALRMRHAQMLRALKGAAH